MIRTLPWGTKINGSHQPRHLTPLRSDHQSAPSPRSSPETLELLSDDFFCQLGYTACFSRRRDLYGDSPTDYEIDLHFVAHAPSPQTCRDAQIDNVISSIDSDHAAHIQGISTLAER